MNGTISLTIRRDAEHGKVDMYTEHDFGSVDDAGAAILVWLLCDALNLGPIRRAAIPKLVAAGKIDGEIAAAEARYVCDE